MHGSSSSSDRVLAPAFALEPERSKLLGVWWGALHGLLLAVIWSLEPGIWPGLALTMACALHAGLRWPRAAPRIVYGGDGRWAVPAWQLDGLTLASGTAFSSCWARLAWFTRDGRRADVVVTRDQVPAEVWWRLQTLLRSRSAS